MIKNFLKLFFCGHNNVRSIILEDKKFNEMTDNDDLDDIPTLVKVTYCADCGKILKKEMFFPPFFSNFYKYISSPNEIRMFCQCCGIIRNLYDEITLYEE